LLHATMQAPVLEQHVPEITLRQKIDRWMVNEGSSKLFEGFFVILHVLVFTLGYLQYRLKDNYKVSVKMFGETFPIARSSALVLHVDLALILLPICRNFISALRRTPLNGIIPFDKSIKFHILIGWSIYFFSWLHTVCHWNNLARLSAANNLGVKGFLLANFATGPGATGYVMLIALNAMVFTSMNKTKKANYERFWYTHHLFFVFFFGWSLHGTFCMLKPSRAPFCAGTGAFWKYWLLGGFAYLGERLYREIRGSHRTYISKVIQHPSKVCEIQIRKENCSPKAGQYIFLCCPEISLWQYHPFTLTSAPEEEYISIHVRCIGDFTNALARKLGCDFDKIDTNDGHRSFVVGIDKSEKDLCPALQRILPRIMIDGPFGSASEDVFKYEVAVLVGAGIGVTPFASILKSIWYRINNATKGRKVRLSKVYFFWICRDFESFEWFRSLLMAIEAQDISHLIEIHTYFTMKVRPDDATNIMLNDAGNERDVITGLKSPTNYGRPDWKRMFRSLCTIHPATDVGVFCCGPRELSSTLHSMANTWSQPGDGGTKFFYGKENF